MILANYFESFHRCWHNCFVAVATDNSARLDFLEFAPVSLAHVPNHVSQHPTEKTLKLVWRHGIGNCCERLTHQSHWRITHLCIVLGPASWRGASAKFRSKLGPRGADSVLWPMLRSCPDTGRCRTGRLQRKDTHRTGRHGAKVCSWTPYRTNPLAGGSGFMVIHPHQIYGERRSI